MEWFSATRISKELKINYYEARKMIAEINEERRSKNLFIPSSNKVPKEYLEKKLGIKIQNKNASSLEKKSV